MNADLIRTGCAADVALDIFIITMEFYVKVLTKSDDSGVCGTAERLNLRSPLAISRVAVYVV